MDKNVKDPSHNPEKKADLIIISPEELVKLGLFQDFSALISSSTSPKSTASSSTTKKKSKKTPSKSARKRPSTTKHELCFRKPEVGPKILPASNQSQNPPQFSKSNPLPSSRAARESSRPVLKKNLEHVKKILNESISLSHASGLDKKKAKKKELKVISDNVVKLSSKELKDLIGKAKIQKGCISTGIPPTEKSKIISVSTVTQNTPKDLIPKCELTCSQRFDSSVSDIHDKELEISSIKQFTNETKSAVSYNDYVEIDDEKDKSVGLCSQEPLDHEEGVKDVFNMHSSQGLGETPKSLFSNNIEISELSGKDIHNSPKISSNLEQEEGTLEMQKVDYVTCQREGNSSLPNILKQEENPPETILVKRRKDTDHIPDHSPKEKKIVEHSVSGEQHNSPVLRKNKDWTDSVKNLNSEAKEEMQNKTAESNLFSNALRSSGEHSTEKIDCSPQITENLKQEENTIETNDVDSVSDKRAKDKASNQVINNEPLADTSEFAANTSDFESNIQIFSIEYRENTTETKELHSVSDQNEKLFLNKKRRQPKAPVLVKRKRGEATNEIKNPNSIAGTFSMATNALELHRTTDISSKSPEEHPLSLEQHDSSYIAYQEKDSEVSGTNLSNGGKEERDEETVEIISEENTTVTNKVDSITDRTRRKHRKPLLIDKKQNKAEATNNNPVAETSNTVEITSRLNSTTGIERGNPVEHLLSTEQSDSSSIPVSCQDSFYNNFSKRLCSDVKEEVKNELKESVLFSNELERSGEEMLTQLIKTASEKSSVATGKRLSKLFEVAESVSVPRVVNRRGRSRKSHLEISQFDESKETVLVSDKSAYEVTPEIKNRVDAIGVTKIVSNTTGIQDMIHCSTPLPKKRGRSKKNHHDEEGTGKKFKPNNKKNFTNEEKDVDTSTANEVILNDSSLLGTTGSSGTKGKQPKTNLTKRFRNEGKEADTSTASEVILNDSSLLVSTQSDGKKGKNSKANNKKTFTSEEKNVASSTANEETFNDSSLLGTTRSARKKGKQPKANNINSFTAEEKNLASNNANEVILNDSSLLGTTRSARKKGKQAKANNAKSFTAEEKNLASSTANEVILNDSSLLGTTRSARKRGKQSKVSNTERLTNEEKDADTSTANEVILNDSSLLGTTQSARKKEKKSKAINANSFTNEEKNADTSIANEVTLNDSSLLGASQSDDDTTELSTSDCLLKVVKKKGRPKKNSLEEKSESKIGVALSYTIEKSRSGRARRKVNYLDLELNSLRRENVELAPLDDDRSHSLDVADDSIRPKKPRVYVRKKKTEELDTKRAESNISTSLKDAMVTSESLDGFENFNASASPEKCTAIFDAASDISEKCKAVSDASPDTSEKCKADISEKCQAVLDSSSDILEKCTAIPDSLSYIPENCTAVPDASTDISETNEAQSSSGEANTESTSTPIKSKYVYNGHSSKMLSSVFSAAFRADQDTSVTSNSSSQELLRKKRKSGRPKKYVDDISNNGIPDGCEVSCVICEEKMLNGEWDRHNATRHYYLGWRKGEPALNLDDDAVVKRKLKTVMVKSKKLLCQKCDHSCKDMESFLIHREECLGILVNGLVTCAVCNSQMDRQSWLNHKLKIHNNLAWRVGDIPLDLNDQDFVMSVLNALYKIRRPLFCDKCQQSKKSVIGFLSHRSQCGVFLETVKVECKLCGRKVLPVSMPSHIKLVHETPKANPNRSDYFDVDPSASKKKRRAAKDAMQIIDSITGESKGIQVKPYKTNPIDFKEEEYIIPLLESELKEFLTIKCKFADCNFATDNVESTIDHLSLCPQKPEEFYICTLCLVICVSETDIRQHITDAHDMFLPNEEDGDEDGFTSAEKHEMEQTSKKKKRKADIAKLQRRHRLKPYCIAHVTNSRGSLFSRAFQFTWDFCSNHYNQPVLYEKFRHFSWNLLPSDLINNYLPVTNDSCDVASIRVTGFDNVLAQEHTLKQFDLFEVEREDEYTTIFCGGPITAMAWAPTPHTSRESSQVLAVATTKDFDSKYRVNAIYEEPSVIQFWDFGRLSNRGLYPEASQMLFLAMDCGPIWHMEWCPSGCYDQTDSEEFERLGLLAVAGSVPTVFIYAIPMIKDEEKRGLFYKEEPLLKLQIHPSNTTLKTNFYPTKISWTKASGHKYIAVGYSDGMVALFNVQSPSSLLIIREPDGGGVLLPYRVIPAHKHYISALSLVHLQGGDKLLLTGSYDKDVHVWNLDRRTKITAPKKRIITDGAWLTNWLSYVTTSDDSNCVNNLTSTIVSAYRNYLSEPSPIMFSKAAINSITASDWLNGFVQGNEVGEVQACFQGQMLYSLDAVKRSYLRRYLLSYTKLIDKHQPPEVRAAEEDAKQKIITIVPGGLRNSISDVAESTKVVYKYFEPMTYAGARKKYGLVFCDFKLDCLADFPPSFQKKLSGRHDVLDSAKPNLYNLQAANKVCFNPNRQASLYVATGYQAGFVRVSYLKFLEKDDQIRRSM